MDKKSTIIIGAILLFGVIGYVAVSFQRSSLVPDNGSLVSSTTWENIPAERSSELVVTPKTIITAKHSYVKGKHTFAGEVPLPTPCHLLEQNIFASKDKKSIIITLTSSIKSDEVCAQVITPARFKLVANANNDALVTTTLNGQEVTLNLIEAGADENLDNFELYLKG